jgi:hypothetical protein
MVAFFSPKHLANASRSFDCAVPTGAQNTAVNAISRATKAGCNLSFCRGCSFMIAAMSVMIMIAAVMVAAAVVVAAVVAAAIWTALSCRGPA